MQEPAPIPADPYALTCRLLAGEGKLTRGRYCKHNYVHVHVCIVCSFNELGLTIILSINSYLITEPQSQTCTYMYTPMYSVW